MLAAGLVGLVGTLDMTAWVAQVYWLALVVGGGLLVISTLFGGDHDVGVDTDVDVDMDMDVDMGVDLDGGADGVVDGAGEALAGDHDALAGDHGGEWTLLTTWFSVRFMVYFAAMFGVIGVVLTNLTEMGSTTVAIAALVGGLLVGQGVQQIMRTLVRTSGNSAVRVADYLDKPARVTVAIQPRRQGQVAVTAAGGERYLVARAKRSDDGFKVGDAVMVTGYANGTAEVVSQAEFEFMHSSQSERRS